MSASGSCLCGTVKYIVDGPLRGVTACHCSQCRKQSGHYYAATSAANADLSIEGGDNITWFEASDDAKRGFCKTCGSALFWKHNNEDETSIMAGSLDNDASVKLIDHIFVADKGDYYEIEDGLPTYPQGRDS
jgi:hypothetical protein